MQKGNQLLAFVETERDFFGVLSDEDFAVAFPYYHGWKTIAHFNLLSTAADWFLALNRRALPEYLPINTESIDSKMYHEARLFAGNLSLK